jgi:hypothetical protein
LHNTTRENISLWTTGCEFFEEQVCFIVFICIEEGDGLKYVMKRKSYEANVAYLNQE